jgi:hypothetical protein
MRLLLTSFAVLCVAAAAAQTLPEVSQSELVLLRAPADITFSCDAAWTYADAGTPNVLSRCALGTTPLTVEIIEGPEACDGGRTILRRWSVQDRCSGTVLQVEQEILVVGRPLEIIGPRALGPMLSFSPSGDLLPPPELQVLTCSDYTLTGFLPDDAIAFELGPLQSELVPVEWHAVDACGNEATFTQGLLSLWASFGEEYPEVWPGGCDDPLACNYTGPVAYETEVCTYPQPGMPCYENSWWCRGGVEEGNPDFTPPVVSWGALAPGAEIPEATISDNVPLPVQVQWERGTRWNDVCGEESAFWALRATDACGNILRDTVDVPEPWPYMTTMQLDEFTVTQSEFEDFLDQTWNLGTTYNQSNRPDFAIGRQSLPVFSVLTSAPCTPAEVAAGSCVADPVAPGVWVFEMKDVGLLCGSSLVTRRSYMLEVVDDLAPVFNLPDSTFFTCAQDAALDYAGGFVVIEDQYADVPFAPFGTVGGDGALTVAVEVTDSNFTCPNQGTAVVHRTACDAAGNCASHHQVQTIHDSTPPTFASTPATVDMSTAFNYEEFLQNALPANDNCGPVEVEWQVLMPDWDFCDYMRDAAIGTATDVCGNSTQFKTELTGVMIQYLLELTIVCPDPFACNYTPDPGVCEWIQYESCIYPTCTDPAACNYEPAEEGGCSDNSRCVYPSVLCALDSCAGDLDGDAYVGVNDLLDLLAAYGLTCP